MKRIKNAKELKTGTRIINLDGGNVYYYEFLMVHPHNDQYVLLLDNISQNAKKFYIPNLEDDAHWQVDCTYIDLLNYRRNYYLEMADKMLELINLNNYGKN